MKAWEVINRPVFIVSDLHAGDGGPRDSFRFGNRLKQFFSFLQFVKGENGRLVIAGDLFDFWQSNVSKVIVNNLHLVNWFSSLHTTYILGNHDADLNYFPGTGLSNIALIQNAVKYLDLVVAGKKFTIIHGHQADPYCVSDTPGVGRVTAIISGIAEDRHGGPMASKYKTIAQKVVGPMDRAVSHFRWLTGRPSREVGMNLELLKIREQAGADVLISGHTHKAGQIKSLYYNTGCWCEFRNSFVRIEANGFVSCWDWRDGRPVGFGGVLPV